MGAFSPNRSGLFEILLQRYSLANKQLYMNKAISVDDDKIGLDRQVGLASSGASIKGLQSLTNNCNGTGGGGLLKGLLIKVT